MTHRLVIILSWLASIVLIAPVFGDTVALRTSTRIESAAPITLSDVAHLDGPDAMRLSGIEVLGGLGEAKVDARGFASVSLDEVRRIIERDGRVSLGRLELSGTRCIIIARAPARAPLSTPTIAVADAPPGAPAEGTVRAHVERTIRQTLGVEADDLRVSFRTSDQTLLAMPAIGRTVSVRVIGRSSNLPLGVTVYQGDRIIASGSVRAQVRVRRSVVVAAERLGRGQQLRAEQIRVEQRWVDPTLMPATRKQVLDSVLRKVVRPGEPIELAQIEAPILIDRGEIVVVHCIAGTIIIEQRARAKGRGRDGEIIEFESLDRPRRMFSARVSGPGRAVVVADRPTSTKDTSP